MTTYKAIDKIMIAQKESLALQIFFDGESNRFHIHQNLPSGEQIIWIDNNPESIAELIGFIQKTIFAYRYYINQWK